MGIPIEEMEKLAWQGIINQSSSSKRGILIGFDNEDWPATVVLLDGKPHYLSSYSIHYIIGPDPDHIELSPKLCEEILAFAKAEEQAAYTNRKPWAHLPTMDYENLYVAKDANNETTRSTKMGK